MNYPTGALYRAEQIREVERVAIEDYDMPGMQMMRSAGQAAFEVLRERWPTARHLAIFCGAGNNGGDGYVVARLALQAGWQLDVLSVVDIENLRGDALQACRDYLAAGGVIEQFNGCLPKADLIVDALLGTGLTRPVEGVFEGVIHAINATNGPVLAIDLPSGLHADTGQVMGVAVRAVVTITFIGLKAGLFTGQAADYRGEVIYADLDVPKVAFAGLPPFAELLSRSTLPRRARDAHKGCFGHLLLIGGNLGFSGAIRLAGEAALRAGAGLVSIATRPEHVVCLNLGRPELMCHGVEGAQSLRRLLEKATAVVIGPGLGQDDWAQSLFETLMANDKPCVVDADALNLLAQLPVHREQWLLTPHPGEAARLLGCKNAEISVDRYAAAQRLQNRYGGVCVLKGAGSIVADEVSLGVATSGNPGMASGGMGDVLAGVCGALIAQGLNVAEAARLGVQVHGEAADALALEYGERGLLASDLFPLIRRLLNT